MIAEAPTSEDKLAAAALEPRDDEGELNRAFVEAVSAAIAAGDVDTLKTLAGDLHEADLGDLIEALDADERADLVRLLGADFDFAALVEVDETVRVQLLEEIPNEAIAEGVRDLDSDDAVYILEDLDAEDQEDILEQIPLSERAQLVRSLDYPEDSAGRLMQTDFIAVPPFWTVGQTIDYCRDAEDLPDDFTEIYVVDPAFKLVGAVALDKLLRAKRPMKITEIVDEDHHVIAVDEDREEVARLFERYNLFAAPVVDDAERLVGVIMVDDVVDVVKEEAEEDLRALAGVGDEEISDSVFMTMRGRFTWLFVNLFTAFLAAAVISSFADTIEQMVALAALAPIVASMGGNAATQTMTVSVRALATQELGSLNLVRFVSREVLVAFLNGISFAFLVGATAGLWFQNLGLGLVIGGAMVANLLAGGLAGVIVPVTVDKLNGDPAVVSGVFVTTVTDCVGFFAFLGLATWWFRL